MNVRASSPDLRSVRGLWPGTGSGDVQWCFPGCQYCSMKGAHWAHPVYALISTFRGRRNAADRLDPSLLISDFCLLHPKPSRIQALMLSRWLAAVARVERTGARPSSALALRGHRRVDYCLHSSTDFGMCPELSCAGEEFFGNHGSDLLLAVRHGSDRRSGRSILLRFWCAELAEPLLVAPGLFRVSRKFG